MKMSKKDTPIIKCPICGYEYLPAEIFFADEFLGDPGEIIRPMGKEIDCYLGDGMKLAEDFVCDSCGVTPFKKKCSAKSCRSFAEHFIS